MKKTISLLLAIIMVLSLIPITAFAADTATISFDTTFTEGMAAGDTFTVTANLANNPGVAAMTLTLKWNEDVVKFNGFATEYDGEMEEDVLVTDVFKTVWTPDVNHQVGTLGAYRNTNTKKEGVLFVANFEIVGSGELNIGLKDADLSEFEMVNQDQESVAVTVDYSALEGLSVAAPEAEGPVIPDGAPFTAITTDAGDVIAIEQKENVTFTGYNTYSDVLCYHVQIPEGAENVYVTHPSSTNPFLDSAYGCARGYYAETESWTGGGMDFEYEGNTITMPLTASFMGYDASYNYVEIEVSFVADEDGYVSHAVAVENNTSSYDPICFFTFEYGTASAGGEEEPTTYPITVNQTTGGTVTVLDQSMNKITEAAEGDYIFVDAVADEGYSFKQLYIDGEPVELGMTNGFYTMPAAAITVSADFEVVHTCAYDQQVEAEKFLKSEATCQSGAVYYKSCACGEYAETADTFVSGDPVACVYVDGACKWCGAEEPAATSGYTFATSADVSAENGENVEVKVMITGHSDPNVTKYNAYDITLTYDSEKLEYVAYAGAVKSDNGRVEVDAENGTIRIVGCGADKDFGTEIAALTFTTKAEGEAIVTIDKVQVSDKEESVKEDAPEATPKHEEADPEADATPDVSVVVVPYSVNKPGFVSGNDKVLPGEDYTFSFTDTANYTYSGLTVKVGDAVVTPTEANGIYTVANVTGAIEITVTRTANSYDVSKPENVTGPDNATYGTPYVFTVTPSKDDMAIDTVTVAYADGSEVPYTINENGEYVIAGTDITGAFTINVTEREKMTTITFTGIDAEEVEGGQTQAAEIGKAFSFTLIREEGYDYTAKVGDTELTEADGRYTIPAALVVKGGVTVTIEKVDITTVTVDVAEYINLNGKTMFLVTAKWRDRVLAYGEEGTMFWSDKYTVTDEEEAGAYCWLVLSTDEMNTADAVKAAAETAIVEAAEGAAATAVKYNYDINGTTRVDVNDAQLAYDMYNASYMEFTDNLPMLKFLEADVTTDSKLDTKDVAAIISYILSGANA